MITYREATAAEIPYIAKLSAQSFGNYPFFDFAFLNSFQRDDAYFDYMEKLHRIHTKANMQQHKCFVGVKDGKIVSTALLQDPRAKRVGIWDYIKAGATSLVFPVGFSKILNFFSISEEAHEDCAREYPNAWYLEKLAVDPSMKGAGLGSSMIKDCLIPYVKENSGKELTLITNTQANRKFYTKNGFDEFAERTLERDDEKIGNWSFRHKIA
ncbi:GNAT family N-acetyltransferase [Alloscardovia criceti]|uniref:GNAT family N-acetyltransferase n=1 Tax=Alloscardovia criceti TaxID=356828 RepID=UPI000365BA6D|nr:GNAT family N-acetyltransferase [Alloscardovia criceti]